MESLQNILGSRDFTPPSEVEMIKEFIWRRYKSGCRVELQRHATVISVRSAALAGTLRLDQQRLIEACNITKKLIIRIA